MLKSQDVLVLLKLIALQRQQQFSVAEDLLSVRSLASALGLSKSEVSHSLRRSLQSGLAIRSRESNKPLPNAKALYELIVYGLKYVFPPKLGQLGRGVLTSVDAPVFKQLLHSAGENSYVWLDPQGKVKGQSVDPLYRSVPLAVKNDNELYAMLALVDAIRLGRAREVTVAAKELKQRMGLV